MFAIYMTDDGITLHRIGKRATFERARHQLTQLRADSDYTEHLLIIAELSESNALATFDTLRGLEVAADWVALVGYERIWRAGPDESGGRWQGEAAKHVASPEPTDEQVDRETAEAMGTQPPAGQVAVDVQQLSHISYDTVDDDGEPHVVHWTAAALAELFEQADPAELLPYLQLMSGEAGTAELDNAYAEAEQAHTEGYGDGYRAGYNQALAEQAASYDPAPGGNSHQVSAEFAGRIIRQFGMRHAKMVQWVNRARDAAGKGLMVHVKRCVDLMNAGGGKAGDELLADVQQLTELNAAAEVMAEHADALRDDVCEAWKLLTDVAKVERPISISGKVGEDE